MNSHVATKKWDDVNVLTLIELYRSHSVLWDRRHNNFQKRKIRKHAWNFIASQLNRHISVVKTKMRTLLRGYRREQRRCQDKSRVEKDGTPYIPTWYPYEHLRFLRHSESTVKTEDTLKNKTKIKHSFSEKPLWLRASVLKLIELYGIHPVLWNKEHRDFHVHEIKNQTWSFIANQLGRDVMDVRTKMTNLMRTFRKTQRNCRRVSEDGSPFVPTWFAYEQLRSIMLQSTGIQIKDNASLTTDTEDEKQETQDDNAYFTKEEHDLVDSINNSPLTESAFEEILKHERSISPVETTNWVDGSSACDPLRELGGYISTCTENTEEEIYQHDQFSIPKNIKLENCIPRISPLLNNQYQGNKDQPSSVEATVSDEDKAFTDYMYTKIQKFNDPVKAKLKHQIYGLLIEAEMKCLNNGTNAQ